MRIVVDASAVVTVLLRAPAAERIVERLRSARGSIHAPYLIDLEVAQILRRHAAAHPDQVDRCRQALLDLREMPVFRYSQDVLFDRIWELRQSFTVSDASYLALAEFLAAPLLTCDERLKTSGHKAEVVVFSS
jgi:predicted nucleic acid-binding protein